MTGGGKGNGPEIVIIRRRAADEVAAHKGGAWKIAYADFVTAMMAFFLVMWLINAANEATRAQVASYFNPIKLTDSATGGRGLNDPKEMKAKDRKPGGGSSNEKATDAEKSQEQQLLSDPLKALERIAPAASAEKKKDQTAGNTARPTGASDPFDPQAWQHWAGATEPSQAQADGAQNPQSSARENSSKDPSEISSPQRDQLANKTAHEIDDRSPAPDAEPPGRLSPERRALQDPSVSLQQPSNDPQHSKAGAASRAAPESIASASGPPEDTGSGERLSAAIKADILKKLNVEAADMPAAIEVRQTSEGEMISLTDRTVFGMFQIGSSEPDPKLVEILAAIAQAVKDRPGDIVVRGHTDSRPYRNRHFDNWQLSAARAQMAYYMLVRGGLEDRRVKRIEGLADRDPLIPEHPDAPENRRIEILLGNAR